MIFSFLQCPRKPIILGPSLDLLDLFVLFLWQVWQQFLSPPFLYDYYLQSPTRVVPAHIAKPDYAVTGNLKLNMSKLTQWSLHMLAIGIPVSEQQSKSSGRIIQLSKKSWMIWELHVGWVESLSVCSLVCMITQLGREVLDIAAAAIRPGVTTDEIDRLVHEVRSLLCDCHFLFST